MNKYVRVVSPVPPNMFTGGLYRPPFLEASYVFDGTRAFRSDAHGGNSSFLITDPDHWRDELARHEAKPGEPLPRVVEGVPPGGFYPRMARVRNVLDGSIDAWTELGGSEVTAASQGQLSSLLARMQQIVAVAQPTTANMACYGHEIRNLLILACTEVEAQWKGVLTANSYTALGRLTTNDYVKLENAMKLSSYSISFSYFPWLQTLTPFEGWIGSRSPTRDLFWYDNYNAVKHDREAEFHRATLSSVLSAIAACAIMLAAQFGKTALDRPDMGAFFRLTSFPDWGPGEQYVPAYPNNPQLAAASINAGPIPYPF